MSIDFTTPMTFYELVGIILAGLALLIPFVKWIIEKWFKRLKIDFLISDIVTIYFNKSGSYINLGGVYKTKNKTATIKNISAQVIRKSDNATLNLSWSTFPSPIVKEIAGQYEHTFETAHPFSANADMLTPAFIEFTNEKNNIGEEIAVAVRDLYNTENSILFQQNISLLEVDQKIHATEDYSNSKIKLHDFFFWKLGLYEINLLTEYDNKKFTKKYTFELNEDDIDKLQNNIESILIDPIATHFNLRATYYTVRKVLNVQ